MNEIINAIPEYVQTAVISAVLILAIRYAHTFIHAKAQQAKTAQSKELWGFMDQVAEMAVNSLVSADKTGNQKFSAATDLVQAALNKQGLKNVDVKAIEAAVQSAYEKSDLTGNKEILDPRPMTSVKDRLDSKGIPVNQNGDEANDN